MAPSQLLVSLLALICIYLASSAEITSQQNRRRSTSDPVSNFFSGIGDFLLDLDGTIAVQTAPLVEFEDNLVGQMFGPVQSRKDYFDRVQENYRDVQRRLGSLIADAISPKQNGISPQIDPFRSILIPFRSPDVIENGVPKDDSNDVLPVMERRRGDIVGSESNPQGRIIGDVLYSESRFDKYIRQLLRDHGRWVLDNPLLRNWRDSRQGRNQEPTEEAASVPFPETTEETTAAKVATEEEPTESTTETDFEKFEISYDSKPQSPPMMAASYYSIDNAGRILNEEVDIILNSDPEIALALEAETQTTEAIEDVQETEKVEPRDTLILAFTPDGIPLKLRMDPEIENPLEYLHKVLRRAGVTLKVPVGSYKEPAGKEVLLLGSDLDIMARVVNLDLSNPNELKSLLRNLMKSKIDNKDNY